MSDVTGTTATSFNPGDPAQVDSLYRRIAFRLIPFLAVAYVLAFLDRVNISFAKLQMTVDLGLSETAYSACG